MSLSYPYTTPSLLGLLHTAVQALVQGKHSLLSSSHLRISSLSTGEHIPNSAYQGVYAHSHICLCCARIQAENSCAPTQSRQLTKQAVLCVVSQEGDAWI